MNKGWCKEAILQENRKQQVQRLGGVARARLSHSLCATEEEQFWLLIPVFKCSELPEARVLGMKGIMIISMIC